MSDVLADRRCRFTVSVPVATPGDYAHVTSDQLVVGGDAGEIGNRVQFKGSKTLEKAPNSMEITISNLSKDSRQWMSTKGSAGKATLECGYSGSGLTQIFVGDVKSVDHIYNKPDWETVVKVSDGLRGYSWARLDQSFAGGTGAGVIMRALANAMGIQIGNVPQVVADLETVFDQGYTVSGSAQRSLYRLCVSLGYTMSIQDQTLQILRPNQVRDLLIPEIAPDSGLIGSPEMGTPEKKGGTSLVKFKSLLIPTVPGAKVRLRSDRYNGEVREKKCEFDGDTHGGNWYTIHYGVVLQ